MSIDVAERLKSELTDKYVLVSKGVPELRRFEGLTGTVKTVNMNGRALVQFDSAEDISWYDIDPSYLVVVDEPLPKTKAEPKAAPKPAAKPKAAPSGGGGGGKSVLEMLRAQKPGATADKPAAAKPAGGGSVLDQLRAEGAKKKAEASGSASAKTEAAEAAEAEAAEPAAPAEDSAPAPKPAAGKTPAAGQSVLDMLRAEGEKRKRENG